MRRIDLVEAGRRFDRVLATAPERSTARARALLAAASIDLRSGATARGHTHAEESYAVAAEIGDARSQWRALQFAGELSLAHDDVEVASRRFEQGLELARREGFVSAEATGVYSLGIVHWALGDLPRAEAHLADAADRFRALAGSPERIPSPLNFAETIQPGGRPGFRMVFEDTLQPFVEMSCEAAVGYVLANQAGIVRAGGDLPRARMLLDESAARFTDSGDEHGVSAVLARRAYLELADGAPAAAREALEQALELRRRQRDRRGLGLALTGLGLIDTLTGEYASAEQRLTEARRMFRRAGDRWGLANALWRTADLAFATGEIDDAERALQEARGVLGPTQRERWIANTLAGLAEVAVLRDDIGLATALLVDAQARYAARHDAVGAADIERRLSELANGVLRPVKDPPHTTPLAS